ncbi:hypothetical protein C2G38_2155239 [Gigaspora rosea]|uniref:Uncharacterized protein n=1 Tax=Gigaspora rosea TaxID=44941 RepID=A0A397W5V7_9GLOM|nr:hypothetical protein C2G38_2155239 [Gigaspora rosea]
MTSFEGGAYFKYNTNQGVLSFVCSGDNSISHSVYDGIVSELDSKYSSWKNFKEEYQGISKEVAISLHTDGTFLENKFAKEWKKAIEISKVGKKPSLLKALDRTIGWHVLVLAVYKTYRQLSTINITFSNASYSDIHNRMFDASSKTVDPPSALKRLILSTFLFLILTASTFFTQWSSPIWYYGAYYLNN